MIQSGHGHNIFSEELFLTNSSTVPLRRYEQRR